MGKILWTSIGVLLLIGLVLGLAYGIYYVGWGKTTQTITPTQGGQCQAGYVLTNGACVLATPSTGGCSQNPSITLNFRNKVTGASVTALAMNYVDSNTKALLGSSTTGFADGLKVTPLINASGYINIVASDYVVKCGNQQLTGDVYQFTNASIKIYNVDGTGRIGGIMGTTGNESTFSTSATNKIHLEGASYKTTGKQFVVYEIANTTAIELATLSEGGALMPTVSIPNCYTNNLTGTPYRVAWEIPALENGDTKDYYLYTKASNSIPIKGQANLYIYNEQPAIDSLNSALLTSGICDSGNKFYGVGAFFSNGVSTSTTPIGQANNWNIL